METRTLESTYWHLKYYLLWLARLDESDLLLSFLPGSSESTNKISKFGRNDTWMSLAQSKRSVVDVISNACPNRSSYWLKMTSSTGVFTELTTQIIDKSISISLCKISLSTSKSQRLPTAAGNVTSLDLRGDFKLPNFTHTLLSMLEILMAAAVTADGMDLLVFCCHIVVNFRSFEKFSLFKMFFIIQKL